jgi:uncharacterized protein
VNVLYLHGFASSPQSSKATFFRERLAPYRIGFLAPDFNQPDFEHLTITRMLDQVRDALSTLSNEPVVLIGSSLGAFVAVHAAAAARDRWGLGAGVRSLVLLAPALDFGRAGFAELGEAELARWKSTNRRDVHHHAYDRTLPLAYDLIEDAVRYDSFAVRLDAPVLIFQGSRDTLVNPMVPVRWAEGRPNVTVTTLDDEHQLLSSLDRIWSETFKFARFDHVSARPPLG